MTSYFRIQVRKETCWMISVTMNSIGGKANSLEVVFYSLGYLFYCMII